ATMGNIEHSIGGACHDALDAIRCLWDVDAIHGDEVVVDVVDVHSACLKVVEVVVCLRASRRIGAWGRGGRGRRGSGWSGRWGWGWSRGGAGQSRGLDAGVLERVACRCVLVACATADGGTASFRSPAVGR